MSCTLDDISIGIPVTTSGGYYTETIVCLLQQIVLLVMQQLSTHLSLLVLPRQQLEPSPHLPSCSLLKKQQKVHFLEIFSYNRSALSI